VIAAKAIAWPRAFAWILSLAKIDGSAARGW
jgi:hypothetical protein